MKIRSFVLMSALLFTGLISQAQEATPSLDKKNNAMKTYLIERDIPNAGKLNSAELKGISQKSCSVLAEMGPQIEWIHSYVTGNKIYCVYKAENEQLLKDHAKAGGFPINKITEVANVISPETAK